MLACSTLSTLRPPSADGTAVKVAATAWVPLDVASMEGKNQSKMGYRAKFSHTDLIEISCVLLLCLFPLLIFKVAIRGAQRLWFTVFGGSLGLSLPGLNAVLFHRNGTVDLITRFLH